MLEVKIKNRIISAAAPLPQAIRNIIINQSDDLLDKLREIRLRLGLPFTLNIGGNYRYIAKNGCILDTFDNQSMMLCTEQMISDTFKNICGFSVYSHLSEITSGYVTMPFGHRAGISGTAVMSEGKIINIRDISSISIRISRQITGVASDMSSRFSKSSGGLLICGVPCSGKTTFIRDMSRLISTEHKMCTAVIDTRNEISGTYRGKAQNDLGFSDVFVSYPRAQGIEQALRSMSPQVIVCDEIGDKDDFDAILSAVNSGARIIATIHAGNPRELMNRMFAKEILSTKAFSAVAFLSAPATPSRVSRILSVEDVARA